MSLWGFELGSDCFAVSEKGFKKTASKGSNGTCAPGFISGYISTIELSRRTSSPEALEAHEKSLVIKKKKMMALGQSPGKQLMMTGFMLWMSGAGINIFSIMMTGMALMNPVKALLSMGTTFQQFDGVDGLIQAELMFIGLNGIGLAFAVYKLGVMGLLPLSSGDWISMLDVKQPEEYFAVFKHP
uniref:ER membrane protein complex subunit 4 n=1 Tax=Mucochytrium quahogii TaxID=96639 RepID=A0A7S2RR43_9STRA|mmetsp:Transcript_4899/g.7413  ORF Transcript_4899/g.7413 Transcript_4899/m.7413 type:complete len:185 (+) Transcript_4899:93-647(+)